MQLEFLKQYGLRPSASSRWMQCTASAHLYRDHAEIIEAVDSQRTADGLNEAREEGTRLHDIAANALYAIYWHYEMKGKNNRPAHTGFGDVVDAYIKYVTEVTGRNHNVKNFIEQTLEDDELQISGTPDLFSIPENQKTLQLFDLKTGRVPVYAENNTQLMIYAVLALKSLYKQGYDQIENLENIELHIVQPVIDNYSVHVITIDELKQFEKQLLNTLLELHYQPVYSPSPEACKYCYFNMTCEARRAQIAKPMRVTQTQLSNGLVRLSNAKLNNLLKNKKTIVEFLEQAEEHALERMKSGEKFKSVKLVRKSPHRVWINEKEARTILKQQLPAAEIEITKLKSPATIEKLFKKTDTFDLDHLIFKPQGGLTMADRNDKRREVTEDEVTQTTITLDVTDFKDLNSET